MNAGRLSLKAASTGQTATFALNYVPQSGARRMRLVQTGTGKGVTRAAWTGESFTGREVAEPEVRTSSGWHERTARWCGRRLRSGRAPSVTPSSTPTMEYEWRRRSDRRLGWIRRTAPYNSDAKCAPAQIHRSPVLEQRSISKARRCTGRHTRPAFAETPPVAIGCYSSAVTISQKRATNNRFKMYHYLSTSPNRIPTRASPKTVQLPLPVISARY